MQKLANPSFHVMAIRIGGAGLALAAQVLASRIMGAEEFGRYALVLVYLLLFGHFATFGTAQLLCRLLAEYLERGERGRALGLLNSPSPPRLAFFPDCCRHRFRPRPGPITTARAPIRLARHSRIGRHTAPCPPGLSRSHRPRHRSSNAGHRSRLPSPPHRHHRRPCHPADPRLRGRRYYGHNTHHCRPARHHCHPVRAALATPQPAYPRCKAPVFDPGLDQDRAAHRQRRCCRGPLRQCRYPDPRLLRAARNGRALLRCLTPDTNPRLCALWRHCGYCTEICAALRRQ
ncbi:oligosaccharide flippase family protein [Devosia chinhatensis]|uniref:Oligosaccharide flippase family protein n=1 Tax=Devosia aurantiaca TaxID=2714858 RepID=A0A6M1SN01_9HYPH|nr:oligosaccharide flippase family protein [Devosia aurantiaca]